MCQQHQHCGMTDCNMSVPGYLLDCGCIVRFVQVDALKFEPFVDSFIAALGLDKSYTLLVLNPKWSASLPSYGYRIGFSEHELRLLNENVSEGQDTLFSYVCCQVCPSQTAIGVHSVGME